MKLSDRVLEGLAGMVVGDNSLFPYRSSSSITRYFERSGFPFVHNGTTRKWWTKERLAELNLGKSYTQDLPSDDLLRIISELFDPDDFEKHIQQSSRADLSIELALAELNKLLKRDGLAAYIDTNGRCLIRNTGTGI